MQFAQAIVDEAHEINAVNMQVLEFDEPLASLEKETAEAIASGDEAQANSLARRLRQAIIANGYADDDELPTEA